MGIVHHSVYLVWLEQARTRLCVETGHHYADIERLGYYLVVTGAEMRYVRGATYGDTVQVECWLEKMMSRRLRFAYRATSFTAAPRWSRAAPPSTSGSIARTGGPAVFRSFSKVPSRSSSTTEAPPCF